MVLPAQVSGAGTWLLDSAGIFSPTLRNAAASSQPRLCVFSSRLRHKSLRGAGCERGARAPASAAHHHPA